jgi:hypothetical protein
MLAAFSPYLAPVMEVEEGVQAFFDNENHIPAAAPVATIRPATWHVLLTPEGNAAIAAVTGAHRDPY